MREFCVPVLREHKYPFFSLAILLVLGLLDLRAFGLPGAGEHLRAWVGVAMVVAAVLGACVLVRFFYMSKSNPLISLSDEKIRFRSDESEIYNEVHWSDVAGTRWIGYENAAIELTSGELYNVSYAGLSDRDREFIREEVGRRTQTAGKATGEG